MIPSGCEVDGRRRQFISCLNDGHGPGKPLVVTSLALAKRRRNSSFSSEDWFSELDKLNFALRAKPRERDSDTYQPVKIAILNTGVSADYADSVKGYRDFVSRHDDGDCQDNIGHGTIRLIQQVYNIAEIYIRRVFESPQATDKTAILMTEAIRHAKSTWKVDIMVISSGFWSEDREMEKAIDEARNANILIFAAASNYGNAVRIAFPGSLYINLKLLCMFSTNPNVRAISNFNPSALSKARYNFAILGENIRLPNLEKPLSGTSHISGKHLKIALLPLQKCNYDEFQGLFNSVKTGAKELLHVLLEFHVLILSG